MMDVVSSSSYLITSLLLCSAMTGVRTSSWPHESTTAGPCQRRRQATACHARTKCSTASGSVPGIGSVAGATPPEDPQDDAELVRLMLDVIALAFESDVTRVVSFMFGNSVSTVNYSFLDGINESHQEASRHQNKPEKLLLWRRGG